MSKRRKPRYCLHKATGQACVSINGKIVYLGKHGNPEPRARYDQLLIVARLVDSEQLNVTCEYRPLDHNTKHHNHERLIFIVPATELVSRTGTQTNSATQLELKFARSNVNVDLTLTDLRKVINK